MTHLHQTLAQDLPFALRESAAIYIDLAEV